MIYLSRSVALLWRIERLATTAPVLRVQWLSVDHEASPSVTRSLAEMVRTVVKLCTPARRLHDHATASQRLCSVTTMLQQ